MAIPIGTISYAAAAAAFLFLSLLLVTSWRGRLQGMLLAAASRNIPTFLREYPSSTSKKANQMALRRTSKIATTSRVESGCTAE